MKFLKHLFSKFFIVALLLLLQLSVITYFAIALSLYFAPFLVVSLIFAVVTILYIINKEEPPEFKLPWLMLIILLPLFGLATYVLFANPRLNKRQTKRLRTAYSRTNKYVHPTEENKAKLKQSYPDFCDIDNYLNASSYSRGYFGCRIRYYPCGENMFPQYLNDLKNAKRFIFIEYFIIARGKMWDEIHEILKEQVTKGVEVRVIYDDIGNSGLQKTEYYRTLRKEGIRCCKFNSFHPVISGVHNYRDHRKITVIDGEIAYTGGINIADEYINEDDRLGYWKDTAIRLEGAATASFTAMFLQLYDMTADTISDCGKYLDIQYQTFEDEGYIYPFGDGPKPYYKDYVGENNFINMLGKAKKYAYITTPYLIVDYALTNALKCAAMRGVDVRIITPHISDKKIVYNITKSRFPALIKSGVKIYTFTPGFIHAKSVIIDGETAFIGTINFDYRSLVHHFECGAVMHKTPCVADIEDDFLKTLKISEQVTLQSCKQSGAVRILNSLLALLTPML